MSKTMFIRAHRDGEYQWFADGAALGRGQLSQLQDAVSQMPGARLVLLLPGQMVLLSQLPCTAKERRHLRKAAPYELEESLISGVEQMHFAFARPVDDMATVACCDREWMDLLLAPLQQAGLEIHQMVPEPLALPASPGWTLRLVDGDVWVRYGHSQGLALEAQLAAVALGQLLDEQGQPQQLQLLADTEQEIAELQQLLPESIRDLCESRLETLPQSLSGQGADTSVALDMRQGDFSNHLPVRRWWRQWRPVAVLAAVALMVFATSQWVQYSQLKEQSVQLRQQIATTVADALSRRAVGDTRRQLNTLSSELKKQRGGGADGGASAVEMLSDVMPLFADIKALVLNSVNINGKSGALRVSCWAPSIDHLQQLKEALEKKQFAATFNASADGDGQQGSFQIQKNSSQSRPR